ncbi:transglycosylase domain-containing protein [Alkalibacter rhizosphaerae]|uniref:Penicillin-binding protein 1A n=1 Tax=Alkalibacter rhizosphaerae TaxID=2815577 RepID=A0A974XF18_9FIRM|nr:transglycosylase domain-containing protein [Alkalibacter rhizosphaerae]QSX08667.1 transglycosylase domain-containing protein [Alkalibacter rhizosphaerae]
MSEHKNETNPVSEAQKNDTSNNNKKSKKRKKKPLTVKQKIFKVFKWFFLLLFILLLVGGSVGGYMVYNWVKDAPPLDMTKFDYIEPSRIVDKDGEFYQELQGTEKREIVSIDQIPDIVQKAFISIEDERFEEHNGVDIQGFTRAGLEVIRTGSLSGPGGSTITQQLIKLTHLTPEKALERKFTEIYLAMELEKVLTKDQIMEAYLNKINFAYAWGVQSASEVYFGNDISEATVAQAAVLAGIIKSPTNYKPYIIEEKEEGVFGIKVDEEGKVVYNEKNLLRAKAVVTQMLKLGHITQAQHDEAVSQLENNDFGLQLPEENEIYSYFTDALYEQLITDLVETDQFSFNTREEAQVYLLNSGLTVHSTLDQRIQNILEEKIQDDTLFPKQSSTARAASAALTKERGEEVNFMPEGAMTIIENGTGHVVGIVGGRSKETSRSLNRATQKFQIGSSTKPLTTYAPGIETKRITAASTFDNIPIQIGSWKPGNAGGFTGMTSVREGIKRSINVIAVQALYATGIENAAHYAELLGLEIVREGDRNDMNGSALALGGYTHGQTTLAMASAYSTFPDQGTRTVPIMYTKITDHDGNVVFENPEEKVRVFSEQTAYIVTDMLRAVVRGGTTSVSVSGMDIAGKTGTTNDQMHAYFAAFSKYYTGAVWYGYDQNKVTAGGRTYNLNIGIYGGSRPGPASLWQSVMREIHKDLPNANLPSRPSGIVTASVDKVSGLLPTELTEKDPRGSMVGSEMFISGTVPTESDDYHIEVRMDVSTGKVASEFCPEHLVETVVRIEKPEDRFPGNIRPANANYVPNSEKGVLAPDLEDICTVHTGNSIIDLAILNANGGTVDNITITQGESTVIRIRGVTQRGEYVDFSGGKLTVTPSTGNVSVVPSSAGNYTVTGISPGSGKIEATITYEYKVPVGEKTETRTYSYSDSMNYTIKQSNRPPTITLSYKGKNGVNITDEIFVGTSFSTSNISVKATDPDQGDQANITGPAITFNGAAAGQVDTSKAGTYVITYTATDKSGAATKGTLTLTVREQEVQAEPVED